jgi:hypothetical protein
VYGDIFIFDTVTSKWTVGPRSPTNRTEVACASSGDFFLAWGGKHSVSSLFSSFVSLSASFLQRFDLYVTLPM